MDNLLCGFTREELRAVALVVALRADDLERQLTPSPGRRGLGLNTQALSAEWAALVGWRTRNISMIQAVNKMPVIRDA